MDLIAPLPWQTKRPMTDAQVEAESAAFFEVMTKTGGGI